MATAQPFLRIPAGVTGVLAGLLALATSTGAEASDLELAVKATYLYKLAPFVTWPASSSGAPEDPLVMCIQGEDPFGRIIDRAVADQRVGSHPIVVRRVAKLDRVSGCRIAYVAGSRAQSVAQALAAVDGAPMLTVTDAEHGATRGIVHLFLASGRVRFAINTARADGNGVSISSKLLALAAEVTR